MFRDDQNLEIVDIRVVRLFAGVYSNLVQPGLILASYLVMAIDFLLQTNCYS